MTQAIIWRGFAGLAGASAVMLMAVGAHGISDTYHQDLLQTATVLQLFHAVALLAIDSKPGRRLMGARLLWVMGILLFCGALYAKVFAPALMLPPLAPVGGISFMMGWLCVAVSGFGRRRAP